jgi:hypothetical protein
MLRIHRLTAVSLITMFFPIVTAYAQFTTIINTPPDVITDQHPTFGAGTQVNIYDGETLSDFIATTGSEVNFYGGGANFGVYDGGVVNMAGGFASIAQVGAGGVTNITERGIASLRVFDTGRAIFPATATTANFVGAVDATFFGGNLDIASGVFGANFRVGSSSTMLIRGGEFYLDGVPVAGLNVVGNRIAFDIPEGAVLTGTFANGTPFNFSTLDTSLIATGVLSLEAANLPVVGSSIIHASTDAVPLGIRDGQTLIVDAGGTVADYFRAGRGSTMNVEPGGIVGGSSAAMYGSVVNVIGGNVGGSFEARSGSEVNVLSGLIGSFFTAFGGSTVNIEGGSIGDRFRARPGVVVNQTGGTIGKNFEANNDSIVNVSGGSIGHGIKGSDGSNGRPITLIGGDFRLNDVPIAGLDNIGDSVYVPLPNGLLLSGTLADGTPFAISTPLDQFSNGGVTLRSAIVPPVGALVITVPNEPAPLGVRLGQTVIVENGGVLGNYFAAGRGGALDVRPGAIVGEGLEIVDATVDISGGTIGSGLYALRGSDVNISGGVFDGDVRAYSGSQINISGGSFGAEFLPLGGEVNISGGSFPVNFEASNHSLVNITGGTFGDFFEVIDNSTANISGGTFGPHFDAADTSVINLFGRQFLIDGEPISGLGLHQEYLLTQRDGVLSGVLADGSPFSFFLSYIHPPRQVRGFRSTARLTLTLVPEPSTFLLLSSYYCATIGLRRRRFD